MTTDSWILVIGTVAGFCTTFAFVPQLVKIWRQGGRDFILRDARAVFDWSSSLVHLWSFGARASRDHHQLGHRHRDCGRYRNESLDRKTRRYQSIRGASH